MDEDLVVVGEFLSVAAADGAATLLRSFGIECFLEDEYLSLWFPHLSPAIGGIKLRVKKSRALEAREILKQSVP